MRVKAAEPSARGLPLLARGLRHASPTNEGLSGFAAILRRHAPTQFFAQGLVDAAARYLDQAKHHRRPAHEHALFRTEGNRFLPVDNQYRLFAVAKSDSVRLIGGVHDGTEG